LKIKDQIWNLLVKDVHKLTKKNLSQKEWLASDLWVKEGTHFVGSFTDYFSQTILGKMGLISPHRMGFTQPGTRNWTWGGPPNNIGIFIQGCYLTLISTKKLLRIWFVYQSELTFYGS
jgi:hypothetical protein